MDILEEFFPHMMPKEPDLAKYGMDGADPEANDKFQDGVTGAFVDKMPSGRKIIKNGGQIWYFVSADTLEKSKVSPKELALHYLKRMNGLDPRVWLKNQQVQVVVMLEDLEAQAHERVWRRLNPVQDHQLAKLPQLNIKELLCEIEFRCTMLHDIAVKFSDKKEYHGWLQHVQKSTVVAIKLEKATDEYFEVMIEIEREQNSKLLLRPCAAEFRDNRYAWSYWLKNRAAGGTFEERLADATSKNENVHARHHIIPPGGQAIIQDWRNVTNRAVASVRANNDSQEIRDEIPPRGLGPRTQVIPEAGNSTRVITPRSMRVVPSDPKPGRMVTNTPISECAAFLQRHMGNQNTLYTHSQSALAQVVDTYLDEEGIQKAKEAFDRMAGDMGHKW